MKKSTIPVTFDEKDGVNLHMFEPVLFTPGQNMWGLDPQGIYEGIYVGWNRPQNSGVEIKIDHRTHIRVTPPIENVWRIWDARDDEIEALRKELERTRERLREMLPPGEMYLFDLDRNPQERRAQMYGTFTRPTYDEQRTRAEQLGWQVVEKELYNPGGTMYRDVLVDPAGNEHGFVDKFVVMTSMGKAVNTLVPDPDAAAWNALPRDSE